MIDLISFKGAQYPKPVILYAVYFYVRFPVSYRDLEEIMAERGVDLYRATLNRWVEVAHMIRKGQLDQAEESGFAQFAALAG
jgi:transposase-like protein